MDPRTRRAQTVRVLGNVALAAGFLATLLNLSNESEPVYLLGFLLVLTGIGLRIEAAITSRAD